MAIYNSSEISRGTPARLGVYPTKVNGVVNVGNVTLTNGDTLPLAYIPFGCFLSNLFIEIPNVDTTSTIRWSLLDNIASPTTYYSAQAWGNNAVSYIAPNIVINGTTVVAGMAANIFGTQYANTLRAIGASGPAVAVWGLVSGVYPVLQLKVTTTAGATTGGTVNIQFMLEWSPIYDAGV